jgi:hypothetical protein
MAEAATRKPAEAGWDVLDDCLFPPAKAGGKEGVG